MATAAPFPAVSEGEKREALEAVLNSATFARSAQLKALMRYICEMEMAGRSEELTEYRIGVEVLGRGKDFGVAEDSSVRNRAYELRQRLERLYTVEQPNAPIRIEIHKGGYVPQYVRPTEAVQPVQTTEIARRLSATPAPMAILPEVSRPRAWAASLILGGVAIACLALGWAGGTIAARPHPPEVLAEAWGPLGNPGEDMLICVATNLHMIVRPHIPEQRQRFAVPNEFYPIYNENHPHQQGEVLYMEPARISLPLAESLATVLLANTRRAFGGGYQILPELEAPASALRDRNTFLIGTSVNSNAAATFLRNMPLNIVFSNDRFAVVDQRKPEGQQEVFSADPQNGPSAAVHYGLLTVISTSDSAGKPRRIVVISGTWSAGIQAAAEFFTSPARMKELKDRFKAGGLPGFPASYQVLLRCSTFGTRLMSYEYAGHEVVQK